MDILLNAMPLCGLTTGIARYVRNLYRRMEVMPGVSVTYFNGKTHQKTMPDPAHAASWVKATDRIRKLPDTVTTALRSAHWLNYEHRLRRHCRTHPGTLYHETAFTPAALTGTPQVFTLHDLSLMEFKTMHPRERVWFFELFFDRRIRYASHIITVSEFMRTEICEKLNFPATKVTAIPEACDPFFFPRSEERIQQVLTGLNLPRTYLLFAGTLEPRKNISLLIDALISGRTDIPLVLTGWEGWGDKKWLETIRKHGLEKRIFRTGYVDDDTLACLYSGAQAFIYPSLYEGFGLPLLEAMSCGCPVICSRAASLPEVAGDAALLVNPHDSTELAHTIETLLTDSGQRRETISKGRQRAALFSWEKTAELTLDVFRKVSPQQ